MFDITRQVKQESRDTWTVYKRFYCEYICIGWDRFFRVSTWLLLLLESFWVANRSNGVFYQFTPAKMVE